MASENSPTSDETASAPAEEAEVEIEDLSVDIDRAANDAQLLIAHAAEAGLDVDPDIVQQIVAGKYASQRRQWTAESETDFWLAFNGLTMAVQPLTLDSLIATKKLVRKGRRKPSPADRAVRRYGFLAVVSMVALVAIQIYWLIGDKANIQLKNLGVQREEIRAEIKQLRALKGAVATQDDPDIENLEAKLATVVQKQEANHKFLRDWNRVWQAASLQDEFQGEVSVHRQLEHDAEVERVDQSIQELQGKLNDEEAYQGAEGDIQRQSDEEALAATKRRKANLNLVIPDEKEKNQLELNNMAAEFVLGALQGYILPLLYGLLGGAVFVLRRLSKEIKTLTYSVESNTSYRLRITMGALAGLTIGWFLAPEVGSADSILPSVTFSFLAGYNVEILFSVMDRLIANLSKEEIKPEVTSPLASPAPAPPAAATPPPADQPPADQPPAEPTPQPLRTA